ncbi:COBRA-like protein [Quillaja saponaria]|uniref:COBRA-like protein n=1 Tax=Quillaja saponaria TaxID=32244 RepID=A0AAD7QC33_QUISA|nr:COBRA-like protein [Quillaja saponaria]
MESTGSIAKLSSFAILLVFLLSCSTFTSTEAYDPFDPTGNITIKWDIISWTPDGYVAVVTMYNFQQYRHIQSPGWTLGWTWAKKEVIWSMMGGQTTDQGDCSKFKGVTPHCCRKDPTVVDLLPGTPYNQQVANCCKGGVLNSWAQDPTNAASSFQGLDILVVPAKIVRPTKFITSDKRRVTQALMTWNVTCTYSQFLVSKAPTCCVSLSSFYNDTIVNCPTCTCGCQNNKTDPGSCVDRGSPYLASVVSGQGKNPNTPLWNLVVQHPNFDNLTELFSFNYKSLTPYAGLNDTAMLWGVKFYNDFLSTAGPLGNVQSEILFRKDKSTFTFDKGWAFPRRIYFNGDNCVMPPPDSYPWLPNASSQLIFSLLCTVLVILASLAVLLSQA